MSKTTDPDGAIGAVLPAIGDRLVGLLTALNAGDAVGIVLHVLDQTTGGVATTTNLGEDDFHRFHNFVAKELDNGTYEVEEFPMETRQ